jgi:hypothetical protein
MYTRPIYPAMMVAVIDNDNGQLSAIQCCISLPLFHAFAGLVWRH